jgi:hypothetical protein
MWKFIPFTLAILSVTTTVQADQETSVEANNANQTPLHTNLDQLQQQLGQQLQEQKQAKQNQQPTSVTSIKPFTGKILSNKVRLRTQPTLDSSIIKELNKDDLFVITGEKEDFYAVIPSKNTKLYVFRTFVLDNVIEGSRVNVRLEPNLDSPVVIQLNSGDRVDGTVAGNGKWLEISAPSDVRFYVAKDFVEKVGDADLITKLEKRRAEAKQFLDDATIAGQKELQKPYDQINLDPILVTLNRLTTDYADVPQYASKAKELQKSLQDAYLQKKVSYLENKTQNINWQDTNKQLQNDIQTQNDKLNDLENRLKNSNTPNNNKPTIANKPSTPQKPTLTTKMAAWNGPEEAIFSGWATQQSERPTVNDFYSNQKEHAVELRGVIESYNKPVKNKPGDYILINKFNNLPMAYLYSNQINLQDFEGLDVTIKASPRPNNHFAYPAYFVLEVNNHNVTTNGAK